MTTMSMVVTSPLMGNLLLCIGASFVLLLNQTVSLVKLGLSVSIDGLPVEIDVDSVVWCRRGGVVSWTDLSVPTPVSPWLVPRLTLDPINLRVFLILVWSLVDVYTWPLWVRTFVVCIARSSLGLNHIR
jgi:hypothetical protein